MKTHVTIDIALDRDEAFAAGGRERRAAVTRCLEKIFFSAGWEAGDEPLEEIFQADAVEHRYFDRTEGATVLIKEVPETAPRSVGPGVRALRIVKPGAEQDDSKTMALEALLYLEAVALAFADRDIVRYGGLERLPDYGEDLLPFAEPIRRQVCAEAAAVTTQLADLIRGPDAIVATGAIPAENTLALIGGAMERLGGVHGGEGWRLGNERFRETATWSGRPARVRGVYRAAVWESLIQTYAAELDAGEADFMLGSVRTNHSVWPLDLEFSAGFFPLALRLFLALLDELGLASGAVGDEAVARRVLPFAGTAAGALPDLADCAPNA